MLTQRGEQLRMVVGVWKVEEVLRAPTDRDREKGISSRGDSMSKRLEAKVLWKQ